MPQKNRFLHSVQVQEQAISADGIYRFDMAVNPLSVVLLCLRPLNDTGTLADFNHYMTICQAVNRVTLQHSGASVFSMRGEDAAALNYFRHGIVPPQCNPDDTDNERRCVVLPILLGRFAFDPVSCFPASRRGELVLELDLDIADTGYDGLRLSVETIELPDAKPKEFERKTSLSSTFAATGYNDIDLPLGNLCRGVLVWGTTGFTGASPAPSWGRMELLLDNMQVGYSATDFEVAHMLSSLMGRQPFAADSHTHRVTTDGNAQTALETNGGPLELGSVVEKYAFLDLDPTRDDHFAVDTKGHSTWQLRANAETADAVRAVTIERMMV